MLASIDHANVAGVQLLSAWVGLSASVNVSTFLNDVQEAQQGCECTFGPLALMTKRMHRDGMPAFGERPREGSNQSAIMGGGDNTAVI